MDKNLQRFLICGIAVFILLAVLVGCGSTPPQPNNMEAAQLTMINSFSARAQELRLRNLISLEKENKVQKQLQYAAKLTLGQQFSPSDHCPGSATKAECIDNVTATAIKLMERFE